MATATFYENRLKIGSFSGDFHLKMIQFYDSRSHFGQVARVLNAGISEGMLENVMHVINFLSFFSFYLFPLYCYIA